MQCLAGGEPQPETKWLKNGIPIKQATRNTSFKPYKEKPGTNNHSIISLNRRRKELFIHLSMFSFSEKSLLIIPGMTESDQGNYSCLVENPVGKLVSFFVYFFQLNAILIFSINPDYKNKFIFFLARHFTPRLYRRIYRSAYSKANPDLQIAQSGIINSHNCKWSSNIWQNIFWDLFRLFLRGCQQTSHASSKRTWLFTYPGQDLPGSYPAKIQIQSSNSKTCFFSLSPGKHWSFSGKTLIDLIRITLN